MKTNAKTRRCAKCGAVMTGEFNQFSTCRNTEACKRRADEAERKSEFDSAVQAGQDLQKRNPFGSEQHRKGYEMVRQATIRFFGVDKLGEYGTW